MPEPTNLPTHGPKAAYHWGYRAALGPLPADWLHAAVTRAELYHRHAPDPTHRALITDLVVAGYHLFYVSSLRIRHLNWALDLHDGHRGLAFRLLCRYPATERAYERAHASAHRQFTRALRTLHSFEHKHPQVIENSSGLKRAFAAGSSTPQEHPHPPAPARRTNTQFAHNPSQVIENSSSLQRAFAAGASTPQDLPHPPAPARRTNTQFAHNPSQVVENSFRPHRHPPQSFPNHSPKPEPADSGPRPACLQRPIVEKWILFPTTSPPDYPPGGRLSASAILALEDGSVYQGRAYGAPVVRTGEVVFNTSITGYQEVFTDPSYTGQIIVLTNPQIGNYGTNADDDEARRPYIEGLVVREWAVTPSNWRSDRTADRFLQDSGIPVISEIDTRALVRKLRIGGVMRGALSSAGHSAEELIEMARKTPSMVGLELATRVSTPERYEWTQQLKACSPSEHIRNAEPNQFHVVAFDFGIKRNILRCLASIGARVTVVPATTTAADVLALHPDGVFLSNGPGDPEPLQSQAAEVRKLIGKKPIFGICLGHQIVGLALGGKTFKLKFGHRGINHPVLNTRTNQVEITVQNHGFCVDLDSINANEVELSHINLNDNTLEGLRHKSEPLFCVQYHPEAAAGPHDSRYLFDDFAALMKEFKK